MPEVSVIIPWSNRPELEITLAKNRVAFSSVDSEVLIANCGGDRALLESILSANLFEGLRLVDIPQARFNKCLAINLGVLRSQSEHIFLLDADVILAADFLPRALEYANERSFVTVEWVVDSNATYKSNALTESIQTMELVWDNGRRVSFEFYRQRLRDQARGGPGLICLLKKHFIQVCGMNSALLGWGWEDLDLIIRLLWSVEIKRISLGEAIHLAHDNARRNLVGKTREQSLWTNMSVCYANYANGRFLGTLDQDISTWNSKTTERAFTGMDRPVA